MNINHVLTLGQLNSVSGIRRNGSTYTWDPPFSLDLTDTDPDIVYCVEVYNITCGGTVPVCLDCNVEGSQWMACLRDLAFIYKVVVTPRSNAVHAMNGTMSAIEGIL